MNRILLGDCLEVMRTLPDCSVDSVVTDPPYGLSFMGKRWDYDVPAVEVWQQCLRVLKPGGHLLAFAGTRTQHRMAVRIEDAGFEIRDMIAWVYGSGFPKSHNGEWGGTALKPALEPITMARRPLIGTVAANFEAHGTGGLNIDAARIETRREVLSIGSGGIPCRHDTDLPRGRAGNASANARYVAAGGTNFAMTPGSRGGDPCGRWPANLIHDGSDDVQAAFPAAPGQQGDLKGHSRDRVSKGVFGDMKAARDATKRTDFGSASRFFYCAKATREERDWADKNTHPTVKPIALMRYLIRLVTPKGGVVLDPFMGSGSTGCAAAAEAFGFIGIDRDPEYVAIAESRIRVTQPGLAL